MINQQHRDYLFYIFDHLVDSNPDKKELSDWFEQETFEKEKEYTIDVKACYDIYRKTLSDLMTFEQFIRDSRINNIIK